MNDFRDPQIEKLLAYKESAFEYRRRREEYWRENYTLYRDTVIPNRLTQRQSVNLPLMKQTIKTLLKDIDDLHLVYFENLDNDKQKEIFFNEYWEKTLEDNSMEIKDVIDKKQCLFFGRTFDQMQIIDGKVKFTIVSPEDILVDRYVDPSNIHSARCLIHSNIFLPLSVIEKNETYDQAKIEKLKEWYATQQGVIKLAENKEMASQKNKKLADLGMAAENLISGEPIMELAMYFVYDRKDKNSEEELFLKVVAENMQLLMDKPLEEVIGVTKDHFWRNHFPYNTWAEDIDNQDFWVDGIADIVRTPNKVLNAWFSQLVENRTLKNLNMNLYNSNLEGFFPQTWEPRAWGMYGIPLQPGQRIDEVFKSLPVADLSESLDEMQFVINMVEKATGATPTQQGFQTEKRITLGEVQLALGEAKERVRGMSKFYTQVWKDRANLFLKLVEAAPEKLDAVKIFKKGKQTNTIFYREISPKDWKSESGYRIKIWSQDEKKNLDIQKLEKLSAVKANMPDNPKVEEVYKRKLLEFADLTPEEIKEAMEYERQKKQMQLPEEQIGARSPLLPAQQPQPQVNQQINQPV